MTKVRPVQSQIQRVQTTALYIALLDSTIRASFMATLKRPQSSSKGTLRGVRLSERLTRGEQKELRPCDHGFLIPMIPTIAQICYLAASLIEGDGQGNRRDQAMRSEI